MHELFIHEKIKISYHAYEVYISFIQVKNHAINKTNQKFNHRRGKFTKFPK